MPVSLLATRRALELVVRDPILPRVPQLARAGHAIVACQSRVRRDRRHVFEPWQHPGAGEIASPRLEFSEQASALGHARDGDGERPPGAAGRHGDRIMVEAGLPSTISPNKVLVAATVPPITPPIDVTMALSGCAMATIMPQRV